MKKLVNVFENKRNLVGLLLLTGLIFTTYRIQENSGFIKKISNFESGIQTCFSRVNQTYMANLLGDKTASYLSSNFQNLTEECLAEGLLTVENLSNDKSIQVSRLLSNLASNVHWFHEDILAPESSKSLAGNSEPRDVSNRFEKIETMKDEILELAVNQKNDFSNSLNQQKNVFYVSATLLMVIMLIEFLSMTRKKLSNNLRETEARAELLNSGGVNSVKLREIIKTALDQNELTNCSMLFSNFYNFATTEKKETKNLINSLVTPTRVNTQTAIEMNKVINKIWEDDSYGVNVDTNTIIESVNLEAMGNNVIDLLAEKLFSQGVQIDLKIPENLMVQGKSEDLEQSLYHLFAYAINSTTSDNGEKSISAYAHKLGDVVAFDLLYSGAGFDEAILKQRVGLDDGSKELDLDLKICQSLLGEFKAKIQLDNKLDQNGNIVGGRVKIIFKTGVANTISPHSNSHTGRLVDLKVGSKKEILANMAAASRV